MPASERKLYVISGLPASGKTTLARALANRLRVPVLDKDDILEALFDSLAAGPDYPYTPASRQRLSRASDTILRTLVTGIFSAVVVSFWRHPGSRGTSGTPVAWLTTAGVPVVEIYCQCPPELAKQRFLERDRHPGHCDQQRNADGGLDFQAYAAQGPLGIGECVRIDTGDSVDLDTLLARLKASPAAAGHQEQLEETPR